MHRYTSKVPSKDTNSRFQANKTLAVRSHFKIGSHFSGNPVNGCCLFATLWVRPFWPGRIYWTMPIKPHDAGSRRDILSNFESIRLHKMRWVEAYRSRSIRSIGCGCIRQNLRGWQQLGSTGHARGECRMREVYEASTPEQESTWGSAVINIIFRQQQQANCRLDETRVVEMNAIPCAR